jgi:hypothetical protein
MKRIAMSAIAGICAVSLTVAGGTAQERSLSQNLAQVNQLLRSNGYTEEDQQTYSHLRLQGDRMIAEITRVRGEARTVNVYETAVADLDPQRIRVRTIGAYAEISLPSRGDVKASLKCETGGITNEWAIPNASALMLELKPDRALADEIKNALVELVQQAKAGLATE